MEEVKIRNINIRKEGTNQLVSPSIIGNIGSRENIGNIGEIEKKGSIMNAKSLGFIEYKGIQNYETKGKEKLITLMSTGDLKKDILKPFHQETLKALALQVAAAIIQVFLS